MSVFGIESATLEIVSTGHPPARFVTTCGLLEPEDALEVAPSEYLFQTYKSSFLTAFVTAFG
jgi:hypothetical protein